MGLAAVQQISDQDVRTTSTTKGGNRLGQHTQTTDGRVYRFVSSNATTAPLAGNLQATTLVVGNHIDVDLSVAPKIGDTSVSVTIGNTATTLDQYADGYLTVNSGTGAGISYLIKGNPVIAGLGTGIITLYDPIVIAPGATTASDVSLETNPYALIQISPSNQTIMPVGVANVKLGADGTTSFGWIQTYGICSVLSDADIATAPSQPLTNSDDTAGAVGLVEAAGTDVVVGYSRQATVSTEFRSIMLTLD